VTLRAFLKENRDEIDTAIRAALADPSRRLNDDERRQWVMNDEGLYNWARRAGVPI
jgi:hypothetical protein